ncbi:hypothetical protein AAG570_000580 [Ranatra chinensis]|uniref:Uncharacterized protein n=1 Tax=Ranatra chinensis TaxID=642074 RepID=A0ABD0YXR8_9HEMI
MASKRRNMFQKNKTQETTENDSSCGQVIRAYWCKSCILLATISNRGKRNDPHFLLEHEVGKIPPWEVLVAVTYPIMSIRSVQWRIGMINTPISQVHKANWLLPKNSQLFFPRVDYCGNSDLEKHKSSGPNSTNSAVTDSERSQRNKDETVFCILFAGLKKSDCCPIQMYDCDTKHTLMEADGRGSGLLGPVLQEGQGPERNRVIEMPQKEPPILPIP